MTPWSRGGAPGALRESLRLIVLTDPGLAAPRGVLSAVRGALQGGCRAIQLRDKGASARELMEVGGHLRQMTREQGALLFVNDRLDVALALEADGVHLGPDDIPVKAVRAATPDHLLVGYSTDMPEEAAAAVADGADYIGCGAVYTTLNKADAGEAIGPEGLDRVARRVEVPVVGIGGIQRENVAEVAGTRAAGIAVMGSVMQAPDPEAEVRALLSLFSRGEPAD